MIKYSQYRKVCLGRDYLTKHYADYFDLDEVANYACMSKYHFCRVFSEVYGESPYHYISKMRIEQAKRLLVTSKLSINDICEAVGYTSVGSFCFCLARKRVCLLHNTAPNHGRWLRIPLLIQFNQFLCAMHIIFSGRKLTRAILNKV